MFIKLTTLQGKDVYYNTLYIRAFRKSDFGDHTVLELHYGTECVKERVEEISEMLEEKRNG